MTVQELHATAISACKHKHRRANGNILSYAPQSGGKHPLFLIAYFTEKHTSITEKAGWKGMGMKLVGTSWAHNQTLQSLNFTLNYDLQWKSCTVSRSWMQSSSWTALEQASTFCSSPLLPHVPRQLWTDKTQQHLWSSELDQLLQDGKIINS